MQNRAVQVHEALERNLGIRGNRVRRGRHVLHPINREDKGVARGHWARLQRHRGLIHAGNPQNGDTLVHLVIRGDRRRVAHRLGEGHHQIREREVRNDIRHCGRRRVPDHRHRGRLRVRRAPGVANGTGDLGIIIGIRNLRQSQRAAGAIRDGHRVLGPLEGEGGFAIKAHGERSRGALGDGDVPGLARDSGRRRARGLLGRRDDQVIDQDFLREPAGAPANGELPVDRRPVRQEKVREKHLTIPRHAEHAVAFDLDRDIMHLAVHHGRARHREVSPRDDASEL